MLLSIYLTLQLPSRRGLASSAPTMMVQVPFGSSTWPSGALIQPFISDLKCAHSSTLAWKTPWTEEPSRLQSMQSLRVGHDLSDFTFTFHFHAMEKEMATHSSVLAWRIPGTEEPSGLPSMGSHRVGHDWSDLASSSSSSSRKRYSYCHLQGISSKGQGVKANWLRGRKRRGKKVLSFLWLEKNWSQMQLAWMV